MKKVCIVTGTRAEYGLLKPVIERFFRSEEVQLQLVVTGMHLSPEYGMTYQEIEKDGYPITAKIDMHLTSDTACGITRSMGIAMMGFADYFETHRPDILLILGDRYEMLVVATAAMMARIPIAHIHGGETTEGAIDEAIRHAITKMSLLHFTATEVYRKRVVQLGENPSRIYNVGALGVENIQKVLLMEKEQLEADMNFRFSDKTLMVTYHPVTLENMTSESQFYTLLQVIENHKEVKVIFTKANADADGRVINKMIDDFTEKNKDRCVAFTSLGQKRYLSALQYCCAVVGNSSSGIIEAPSFGIPTVNIGNRQRGRVCAESVISCGNGKNDIDQALALALSDSFKQQIQNVENPYEGENTSKQIVDIISQELQKGMELKKTFYEVNV